MKLKVVNFILIVFGLIISVNAFGATNKADVIISNVPWMSQVPPGDWKHTKICGAVAYLMAEAYLKGVRTDPEKEEKVKKIKKFIDWLVNEKIYKDNNGYNGYALNVRQIAEIARKRGLASYFISKKFKSKKSKEIDWNNLFDNFRNELKKGHPIIVPVHVQMDPTKPGHFMVLVGINKNSVFVNDPGRSQAKDGKYHKYTIDDFKKSYQNTAVVLFFSPNYENFYKDLNIIISKMPISNLDKYINNHESSYKSWIYSHKINTEELLKTLRTFNDYQCCMGNINGNINLKLNNNKLSNTSLVDRKDFAKTFINLYNLASSKYINYIQKKIYYIREQYKKGNKKIEARLQKINNPTDSRYWIYNWIVNNTWTTYGAILKVKKIWNGYKGNMLMDDNITMYQLLVILNNFKKYLNQRKISGDK